MTRTVWSSILSVCLLTGCAYSPQRVDFTPYTDARYLPRPKSAPIEIFKTQLPPRRFTEMGEIFVQGPVFLYFVGERDGYTAALDSLKKEARKRGGDAVIYFEEQGGGSNVRLRGVLVKWEG